jgi:predicted transcriptional regulator
MRASVFPSNRNHEASSNATGCGKLGNTRFLLGMRVSKGYTTAMAKDSGLRIRVERELREKFLALCRAQDRPAAQVLREFMRDYIAKHRPTNASRIAGMATSEKRTGKK